MRTIYLSVAGGLAVAAGGLLIWKNRQAIKNISVSTIFNGAKNSAATAMRSTYGRVARVADATIHTERDVQTML